MTVLEFMRNVGVSKREYVEEWINDGLIPNISRDERTGELIIPDSARRPYRPRLKPNADVHSIRASMLNACIKRRYICPRTYAFLSEGEFQGYIADLIEADLIRVRLEDGITHYDATPKSETYSGRTSRAIRKFVIDCLGELAERASYGAIKALRSLPDAS